MSNEERKTTYKGYKPRAHQKAVNDAVIGKKGVVVTVRSRRQSGKSFMSENLLLYYAINYKKSISALVSITLAQSRKVFKDIISAVEGSGIIKRKNEQTLEITFINGSTIFFKSSEQGTEALRGYTITGILILDEASFLSESILEGVLPWTNVHKPPMLIVSTPKFKNCFFYRYFMKGLNGDEGYYSIDWNDYDLSEFLDEQKLEEYRLMLPANQFKSEFLGEFLDDDGVVFTGYKDCIYTTKPRTDGDVYIGIDWATGNGGDFTSVTVINSYCEVVYFEDFNNLNTTQTIDRVEKIIKGFTSVGLVLCESNSIGTPMTELLMERLPNIYIEKDTTTNSSKESMVNDLQVAFEQKKIRLLNIEKVINELGAYEATYNIKTKKVSYNAPSGLHDDSVISLMYAYKAYREKGKRGNYSIGIKGSNRNYR